MSRKPIPTVSFRVLPCVISVTRHNHKGVSVLR